MSYRTGVSPVLAVVVLFACAPSDSAAGVRAVTDPTAWTAPPEGAVDPLASHQPDVVDCPAAGWLEEDGELEIDTSLCNYAWLVQPARTAVAAGETVHGGLYWFDLTSPEPAEGHVAILVDGEVLWERTVDIPGAADVVEITFSPSRDLPPGAEVSIHLHNHGQNTWTLGALETEGT